MSNIPTTECTIEDYRKILRCERDNLEHQQKYSRTLENKVQKLEQQLAIAVEALEWYDGLEKMLIGWEIATGQERGTAEKALQQIKELEK